MRVLILTIYHDPEPIPKTGELARELMRRGHQVTVVTAFPHYPSGDLYAGYRLALWRREIIEGVPVLRTFIYPYHGRRSSLRIVNYLSWMVSSMQAAWLAPRCDVLYVWHPPLTVGISAWVISKLKRVPFVYDVQDLWPESALASGLLRPGLLVTLLYRLADWVYARADALLVVSRAAAAYLRQRGVSPEKIAVANHWVETSAFERESTRDIRGEFGWGARFVVMFAGNLGLVQGLDTVLDAAGIVGHECDALFVFVGDGADRARLEEQVAQRGLTNVEFVGRHPVDSMPAFMRAADVLLVHLRPSEIAEYAIPTKILSYLAAGRPIVCATGGPAAELIREANAGRTTPPGDAAALGAAIVELACVGPAMREQLGRQGQEFLHTYFSKSTVIDFYERTLLEVSRVGPAESLTARQQI